ncbi:MAG: energy-coupling factor transporter ATPase [Clostridiales bacterium]|nr:energy-coupling factor transporter ATPase [Clostridiales bacterium]
MVVLDNIEYIYHSIHNDGDDVKAVAGITASISGGEFVAVLGRNGSGKSTLAKLLNALLLPSGGVVYINGISTTDEKHLWDIRQKMGMVFQNPDNQIVGTIVEEDVAFGPENLGVEPQEIRRRVDESLQLTGMQEYSGHAPHLLSGGQKQRVAISGILAMKPACIVLDEATSMLDPSGRKEVMAVLKALNKNEKITIIHITHHMDEARQADRIIVMDKGSVVMDGPPSMVFSQVEKIKSLGLEVPQVTELLYELTLEGFTMPAGLLDTESCSNALAACGFGMGACAVADTRGGESPCP